MAGDVTSPGCLASGSYIMGLWDKVAGPAGVQKSGSSCSRATQSRNVLSREQYMPNEPGKSSDEAQPTRSPGTVLKAVRAASYPLHCHGGDQLQPRA